MPKATGQLVLERALQKLGETGLAARLGISKSILRVMLSGAHAVPDSILLKAVDVVMADLPDFVPPLDTKKDEDRR
jgi:hypothetical protein